MHISITYAAALHAYKKTFPFALMFMNHSFSIVNKVVTQKRALKSENDEPRLTHARRPKLKYVLHCLVLEKIAYCDTMQSN